MKAIQIVLGAAALGAAAYMVWPGKTPAPIAAATALADVILPATPSQNAQIGKTAYGTNCASCHGANGAGIDGKAPPLIHIIYEPNHHGDEAFQRAAAFGVQSHHWSFGDMPPVAGPTRAVVSMIVAYIREVQQANGIN